MIKKKYGQDATNVGDEGGFAPNIQVNHMLSWFLLLIFDVFESILLDEFVFFKYRKTRRVLNCSKLQLLKLDTPER